MVKQVINFVDYSHLRTEIKVHQLIEHQSTGHTPPGYENQSEASITISATEFRAMVHTFQTMTTTHIALFQQMAAMRAQQDQHAPILRQIQQHLGLMPPPQPDIPGPSEPIAPTEGTIPTEETTRADVPIQPTQEATTEPSSPLETPAT